MGLIEDFSGHASRVGGVDGFESRLRLPLLWCARHANVDVFDLDRRPVLVTARYRCGHLPMGAIALYRRVRPFITVPHRAGDCHCCL